MDELYSSTDAMPDLTSYNTAERFLGTQGAQSKKPDSRPKTRLAVEFQPALWNNDDKVLGLRMR